MIWNITHLMRKFTSLQRYKHDKYNLLPLYNVCLWVIIQTHVSYKCVMVHYQVEYDEDEMFYYTIQTVSTFSDFSTVYILNST